MINAIWLTWPLAAAMIALLLFLEERRGRKAAEQAAEAAIKNLIETTREHDRKVSDLADHAQMIGRATIPAIQAVRLAEWASGSKLMPGTCPVCSQPQPAGHLESCAIRKAIEVAG